jgi:ligand-binding SRPBCC domain-containing protein
MHKASMTKYEEEAIAGVTSGLIDLGQKVTFRARPLGVWQTLTSCITALERPYYFRDSMVEGIFRRFDHDHFFVAQGEHTIMVDLFDYTSPLGVVGTLADKLFIRHTLERLLKERNRKIKEIAESPAWPDYVAPGQSLLVSMPQGSSSGPEVRQEPTVPNGVAMPARLLPAIRLVVALTWLYEGLWLKIIRQAPHELAVVASAAGSLPVPVQPLTLLRLIGLGETLLGIGVLTGKHSRLLSRIQIALLVGMNGAGILFGKGSIEDPAGLVITNLPFALCIVALGSAQTPKETEP